MTKLIVVGAVLLVVAGVVAGWAVIVGKSPRATWSRDEERYAMIGLALVAPGAVAFGFVNGAPLGVGSLLLWGALAAVVYGATRLDSREADDLDVENRWLIDLTSLMFILITVLFSLVSLGSVFIPAACVLVGACRFAHLRRQSIPDADAARPATT